MVGEWKEHCPTCGAHTLHCFEQPCGYEKQGGRIVATGVKAYQTCWNPACSEKGKTVAYGRQWEDES